jgi:hypothetical protein
VSGIWPLQDNVGAPDYAGYIDVILAIFPRSRQGALVGSIPMGTIPANEPEQGRHKKKTPVLSKVGMSLQRGVLRGTIPRFIT